MKLLNPDLVPVLPLNGIFCGECVAMGMFDNGVVISYLEKDAAVLIAWDELVKMADDYRKNPNAVKSTDGDAAEDIVITREVAVDPFDD